MFTVNFFVFKKLLAWATDFLEKNITLSRIDRAYQILRGSFHTERRLNCLSKYCFQKNKYWAILSATNKTRDHLSPFLIIMYTITKCTLNLYFTQIKVHSCICLAGASKVLSTSVCERKLLKGEFGGGDSKMSLSRDCLHLNGYSHYVIRFR